MFRLIDLVGFMPLVIVAGCTLLAPNGSNNSNSDDDDTGASHGTDSVNNGDTGSSDCDDFIEPEEMESECVTQSIECGDSFTATTEEGASLLTGEDYQAWFCLISTSNEYTGAERMYRFEHPGGGTNVTFSLDSPCADLHLIVLRWEHDSCPSGSNSVLECEEGTDSGGSDVSIWGQDESTYYVIVDGVDGEEEQFSLAVSCE